MVHRYRFRALLLGILLGALGWSPSTTCADAADAADAKTVAALPSETLPAPMRKSLPARDCMTCPGPPASAPCFDTHRGFLYFGTYPWDDDPVNGFDDCPHGQCGYPGAALSLAWMRCRQANCKSATHHHRSSGRCSTCNAVPHYFQAPLPVSAEPRAEETYR